MAKRKRATVSNPPRKRVKGEPPSHPHGNFDPKKEYKLKSIVAESKNKYLISWEDDEQTGEKFEDSWEPKKNANREAVADWGRQKADKKRLELLSGQTALGDSSSAQSSPASTPARRPLKLSLKRGRHRKVIESSSPPPQGEARHTNGLWTSVPQPVDDLLEIDESQQTDNGVQADPDIENPDTASALFVPAESPAAINFSSQAAPAVQVSDPPSSYFAGGYEVLSSPQTAPIRAIPKGISPEPSQYVPDPTEESTTSGETTDPSVAIASASGQTEPVSEVPNISSSVIVPDSQSHLASSSYIPTATTADILTAPQVGQELSTAQEGSTSTSEEQAEQEACSAPEHSQHPEPVSQPSEDEPVLAAEERTDQSIQCVEKASLRSPEEIFGLDQASKVVDEIQNKSSFTADINVSGQLGSPAKQQCTDTVRQGLTDHLAARTDRSPEQQASPADEGERSRIYGTPGPNSQTEVFTSAGFDPEPSSKSIPLSASRDSHPGISSTSQPTAAQPQVHTRETADEYSLSTDNRQVEREVSEHLDPSTSSEQTNSTKAQAETQSQQDSEIVQSQGVPSSARDQTPLPRVLSETPPVPLTNHVDLTTTTQDQPTSINRFSVTPPRRGALAAVQQRPDPQPFDSSIWGSSFPFQTQVSRPASAGTNLALSQASRPVSAGTILAKSSPARHNATESSFASTSVERATSVPINQFSLARTSDPVPAPPSQSLGINIFGESAPPRPTTPSSPLTTSRTANSMDATRSTPRSRGSLTERIKAMREQRQRDRERAEKLTLTSTNGTSDGMEYVQPSSSAANPTEPVIAPLPAVSTPPHPLSNRLASPLLFAQDALRSPSTVPHLEPLPVVDQEEQSSSGRYETLLPQAQVNGTDDGQQNGSLTATATSSEAVVGTKDAETSNLHTVPIIMVGHQRDQYPQTVYYYRDAIQRFLAAEDPGPELVMQAKHIVDRMRRITMHPDLDNEETLTQYEVDPWQKALWDVSCSAKFRFLKELFDCLRRQDLHIAIVASPGRIMDIIDSFLQGIKVSYDRLGAAAVSVAYPSEGGNIRATLMDTDMEHANVGAADLVIAMDNFVRHDTSQMRAMRQKDGKLATFISLVIPRTVEHIERCLSPDLSDRAASRALISGIYQFRNEAGKLEEGQLLPKETAVALAHYLMTDVTVREWPLGALSTLQDLGSQTESDIESAIDGGVVPASARTAAKRSHEPADAANDAIDLNKRARVAPPGTNPEEGEITHISDSIGKATQSNDMITEEEDEHAPLKTTEKRLQELLITAQDRLEVHVQALSDLQFRHEEQRNRLIEVTNERDNAILTAKQAVTRLSEQSNSMSNIRNKRSELEQQLKEANDKLQDHSVPERAEFEALRLATAQANAEKEKLENRLQSAQKDLEYVRTLYQNSSSAAQQLATQNTDLENQLAVAQNKATGEQARLRQMGYDNFTKNLRNENKNLKTRLENHEAAMRFKDEEIAKLKEASRGRMGTRGTSVPRSPRMGSPMKLDGRFSRQGSPAAGDLRVRSGLLHPLRNG